jgi:hypothetical protein
MNELKIITTHFDLHAKVEMISPLKLGHINDSYLVYIHGETTPVYLLQRINHHIFKDIDMLQHNILRVTRHIRHKLEEKKTPDIERRVLTLIPATDGKWYYFDGTSYWRMMIYIRNSKSYNNVTPALAERSGLAFGDFQYMLSDLPGEPLGETIPNFHNMEFRLQQFHEALFDDKAQRAGKSCYYIQEIEKRADEMCSAEKAYREGLLPKRINHCDTKVNNVLFDDLGNVLCVVDLDTVMPGYVLSDFGDFIRTGANTGAEDDADLHHVNINMEVFKAYAKGYMKTAKVFLTEYEKNNLAFGARLLTYMQTVRFFTDYLNGDIYYKINFPEHNLQRTKAQLKLLESIEDHFQEMQEYILFYIAK